MLVIHSICGQFFEHDEAAVDDSGIFCVGCGRHDIAENFYNRKDYEQDRQDISDISA